jgi:hypothetical protein
MMGVADRILFHGTNLSQEEQKIVGLVLRKSGFSAFNATMELMNRLPGVGNQLDDMARRGVPREDLISALLMTPQELQQKARRGFPRAKEALGQKRGRLKTLLHSARKLGIDPELIRLLELNLEGKINRIVLVNKSIKKFEAATRHLARKSKTPLIHDPRIRVTQLLIHWGFAPADAYRETGKLLD